MMKKPASALLLSFFLMSLLILVSIGVSFLVMKDVRTVRTIVAGAQARYAAEGMSELGLHVLKENLPGYEPVFEDYEFSNAALASLSVTAREASVPCSVNEDSEWRTLESNESVQLALFAQTDDDANVDKIEKFYVQFYLEDEDGDPVLATGDILRWKILGLLQGGTTEAISEYIPLNGTNYTKDNPSIFGSAIGEAAPEGYSHAKYYTWRGGRYIFIPDQPIDEFLSQHDYNYLILTNIIQGRNDLNIKFRLFAEDAEAVCEYVTLDSVADVAFGEARQAVKTIVREGENLPVFDFVLYHTDIEKDEEEETTVLTPHAAQGGVSPDDVAKLWKESVD